MAKTKLPINHRQRKDTYVHKSMEHNDKTTETVPNETPSIREILFRNTQGLDYDNYKTPFYEEQSTFSSEDLHKIQDMELTDKLSYLDSVTKQAEELRTKISDFQKAEQKQKQEAYKKANTMTNEARESEDSKAT